MVKLEDIVAARERIRGNVAVTPCRLSEAFTELCGAQIYFKLENLQRTGSFKERGAAQTKGPGGYSKVTEEPLSGAHQVDS
jgi:threonine dehydratase